MSVWGDLVMPTLKREIAVTSVGCAGIMPGIIQLCMAPWNKRFVKSMTIGFTCYVLYIVLRDKYKVGA